jgi:hypothetical protein
VAFLEKLQGYAACGAGVAFAGDAASQKEDAFLSETLSEGVTFSALLERL